MTGSLIFKDPETYPVVFKPAKPALFGLGKKTYPVVFKFEGKTQIQTFAAELNGIFITDKNVDKDPTIIEFSNNSGYRFELTSNGKDIENAIFNINILTSSDSFIGLKTDMVSHIKQKSPEKDIYHSFSISPSAKGFTPISGLYPSAFLNLAFSSNRKEREQINITTDENVLINQFGLPGILDILIEVKLNWYENPERTIPFNGNPPVLRGDKFGIRFYSLSSGLFSNKVHIIKNKEFAILEDMPTESDLKKLNISPIDIMYFGMAEKLFFGRQKRIKISDNGLPVQNGVAVPEYLLPIKYEF